MNMAHRDSRASTESGFSIIPQTHFALAGGSQPEDLTKTSVSPRRDVRPGLLAAIRVLLSPPPMEREPAVIEISRSSPASEPTRTLERSPWQLRTGFSSVSGHYRPTNEDCCYANIREGLFLVADGIGGQKGGAVASQLLVDTIPPVLVPSLHADELTARDLGELMQHSIECAHEAMTMMASNEPNLAEMGSTLVLAVLAGDSLFLTHRGDSRAYLVRGDIIAQLTKDHSVVQSLIDAGVLTIEEASHHAFRHVILESVNTKRRYSAMPVQELKLLPGDRLLFCTDGLTDVVDHELLGFTIAHEEDPQSAADVLVKRALDNDSKDNISCIIVHVETSRPHYHWRSC